jgi:hypothetical protein
VHEKLLFVDQDFVAVHSAMVNIGKTRTNATTHVAPMNTVPQWRREFKELSILVIVL